MPILEQASVYVRKGLFKGMFTLMVSGLRELHYEVFVMLFGAQIIFAHTSETRKLSLAAPASRSTLVKHVGY